MKYMPLHRDLSSDPVALTMTSFVLNTITVHPDYFARP
jgi:hypothetical protein